MFLSKWYRSTIEFVQFAKGHRIKLHPREWYRGVLLLLLGWGLIGIDSVTFKGPFGSVETKINFVFQFTAALLFLLLARLGYILVKRKSPDIVSFFKITYQNERSGAAILSVSERKTLIRTRAIIGAGGYIGFQLAKVAIGAIDNSIIYGADGLMYALMAMCILKERYNWREWVAIFIAFIGTAILIRFDIISGDRTKAIWGGVLGICSSASLAIILILTSVIVQHDHPIRVAFHQCLWGLIISLCVLAFAWHGILDSDFTMINLRSAILEGFLYAAALICFFQAFYYVDPIIIAISSYSLDIYVTGLESIINHEIISARNWLSVLLIAIGGAILIREEYKKEKHAK